MRLGFVTARAVRAQRTQLSCDPGLGRLVNAIAARVDTLTLAAPIFTRADAIADHTLSITHAQVAPLPELWSFREGVGLHWPVQLAIRQLEARSDVVIVQLPFATPTALIGARTPRVYHVCADVLAIVRDAPHYRGAARVAALSTAHAVERLYRRLLARPDTAAVTHGRALLEHYAPRRGEAVVSSTLRAAEVASVRRARPGSGVFRVLFVGHLRPEKGLDVLVDALDRLRRRIPNAELRIVGPPIEPELARRMEHLARQGALSLAGHRAFGPPLFQEFADADVLALPSFSEGTPRVLVEARAFGCPVVASRVGGVPSSVTHEFDGLLVPPGDAPALSAALLRIADEPALCARLVSAGYETARGATVDALAERLLSSARAVLA